MQDKRKVLRRGDVVWVDLGEHPGSHIQSGRRPCLIVNTDKSNGEIYTVLPGTCKMEKKDFPVHVLVNPEDMKGALKQKTIFMAEQMLTVDRKDILLKTGNIDKNSEVMRKINNILIRQLGLSG